MKKHIVSVLLAGFFWGIMGLFTRKLKEMGLSTEGTVIIRCGFAALFFAVCIFFTDRTRFRVKIRDFWCFIGTGLFGLLSSTYFYFKAISMMDMSTAAVLQYIAPTVVMFLSAILFREKITIVKLCAAALAFAGCCFVSGIIGGFTVTLFGFIFGILSGIGYALFTVFSRFCLQKSYYPLTINFYSCMLACVGASVIFGVKDAYIAISANPKIILLGIATALLTCFLPYLLYTYSLTGLENGKASIISSVEPVVASVAGMIRYKETMSVWSAVGVISMLAAIVLLNVKINKSPASK